MVGQSKLCACKRRCGRKRIPLTNSNDGVQMFASEDDTGHAENASYAAYSEAVKGAYRTLADLITNYFDEHRELYNDAVLDVPINFRPLRDFERTLRIQKLVLRLALKTAELGRPEAANGIGLPVHANGRGGLPVALAPPAAQEPL